MKTHQKVQPKEDGPSEWTVLLAALNIAIGFVYVLLNSYDQTTLVNWHWLVQDIGIKKIYLSFFGSTFLSLALLWVLPERAYVWTLFFLTTSVLIYITGVPDVLPDTARYIIQAKFFELYGPLYFIKHWGGEITPWTDLPLGGAIYGFGFWLFGEHRIWNQSSNIAFFLLTCLFTYRAGHLWFNRQTGLISALLLCCSPYLIIQVPMSLVDLMTMAVFSAIIYLYIYPAKGLKWTIMTSLTVTAGLLCKYSLWLFIPFVLILITFTTPKDRDLLLKNLLATCTGFVIAILFLQQKGVLLKQIHVLMEFQAHGLAKWRESPLGTLFFQVHPFFSASATAGLLLLTRKKDRRALLFFFTMVFVLVVGRGRYILPLFPLLAISGGSALSALPKRTALLIVGLSIITSLGISLLYTKELKHYSPSNLKEAAEYLNSQNCEKVQVLALPQRQSLGQTTPMVALFDLYYKGEIVSVTPWKTTERLLYHPLFFTWKIKRPPFYPEIPFKKDVITVTVASTEEDLEDAQKVFARHTGHFRFRTLVGLSGQTCSLRPRNKN